MLEGLSPQEKKQIRARRYSTQLLAATERLAQATATAAAAEVEPHQQPHQSDFSQKVAEALVETRRVLKLLEQGPVWNSAPSELEKTPHILVEFDEEWGGGGGEYDQVGEYAYLPVTLLEAVNGDVAAAFEELTGIDRQYLISYTHDELYTYSGEEWPEQGAEEETPTS